MELIITKLVELIIAIVVIVIGRYVIPFVQNKVNMSQLTLICSYAQTFVKAVEMMYKGQSGSGDEKLALVTDMLSAKLSELHINVSSDTIRSAIEEAVQDIQDV